MLGLGQGGWVQKWLPRVAAAGGAAACNGALA